MRREGKTSVPEEQHSGDYPGSHLCLIHPGLGAEGAGQLEMLTGTDQKQKKKKPNKSLLSPAKGPGKGHPSKRENSAAGGWPEGGGNHSTPDKQHTKNCGPPRPTKVRYNKLRLPYPHQAVTRHPNPLHNGVLLRRPSKAPRLSPMSAGNKAPFHTMSPENPGPLSPPGRNRTLSLLLRSREVKWGACTSTTPSSNKAAPHGIPYP